ncbi:MAG TPA: CRISPR-associated protein Csx19 [Kofleriaceae bacterium]|nr:CRISPR-associated protein Csx19 [Kofleriaceae bacterium]
MDFVLGRGDAPMHFGDGDCWLLCHCDDGVTWGRLEDGTWQLGSALFPDLCPTPSQASIQEMRVFSRGAEVLVWRMAGELRGRVLRDSSPPIGEGPLAPSDEEHLLLGRRVIEHKGGFTRVGDGTGAEQALPLRVVDQDSAPWPRLCVRHYFTQDAQTGCVRIVVTRLVEVK